MFSSISDSVQGFLNSAVSLSFPSKPAMCAGPEDVDISIRRNGNSVVVTASSDLGVETDTYQLSPGATGASLPVGNRRYQVLQHRFERRDANDLVTRQSLTRYGDNGQTIEHSEQHFGRDANGNLVSVLTYTLVNGVLTRSQIDVTTNADRQRLDPSPPAAGAKQ